MNGVVKSERELYRPALAYVRQRRWLDGSALIADEVPLSGRRVDCGVLTRSGRLIAFEFKLRDVGRVLWQASLNRLYFDRSFIVVNHRINPETVSKAVSLGVEVLSIVDGECQYDGRVDRGRPQPVVRRRVREKLSERGLEWGDYVQGLR